MVYLWVANTSRSNIIPPNALSYRQRPMVLLLFWQRSLFLHPRPMIDVIEDDMAPLHVCSNRYAMNSHFPNTQTNPKINGGKVISSPLIITSKANGFLSCIFDGSLFSYIHVGLSIIHVSGCRWKPMGSTLHCTLGMQHSYKSQIQKWFQILLP